MNWRTGLFRLWMALTVCWVAALTVVAYNGVTLPNERLAIHQAAVAKCTETTKPNSWECFDTPATLRDWPDSEMSYSPYLLCGVVFPAIIFAVGYLGLWTASGFRRTT